MELRHFRYFVYLAEELHFGRAAKRLGVSQPPLSQQIQIMEQEIGARLFERTNRRVELTEVGRMFLPEARAALDQAAHALAVARRAHHGEIGEITIGMTASTPFTGSVTKAILAYRQSYPDVRLTMSEMPSPLQIEALNSGSLQVGFIRGAGLPDLPIGIASTEIFEDRLVLALHEDHPLSRTGKAITMQELAEEPFVFYSRGLGAGFHEQWLGLCHRAGFEPKIAQEVHELSTLLGFIAAGLGISAVAASLQALHVEHVVYRPLEAADATTKMWLIHDKKKLSSPCKAFIDLVLQLHACKAAAA
ncbi:MAG TPA: LysR substrate-binding domain-containing protein [Parvibaculum sp.]|jgi:DNA-binding transcriptional LysR family regulator